MAKSVDHGLLRKDVSEPVRRSRSGIIALK